MTTAQVIKALTGSKNSNGRVYITGVYALNPRGSQHET